MIYVMSDIHGNMRRFKSIMSQINLQADDTLYILGDVIDRYPDGIRILRKIMNMPNVRMLLGNHEYMMLKALDEPYDGLYFSGNPDFQFEHWYMNGGEVTHRYWKHISKAIRKEVITYLKALPLNYDVVVNDIRYKLVHGAPLEAYDIFEERYHSEAHYAVWKRWQSHDRLPEDFTLVFGHTPTKHYQYNIPMEIWTSRNLIGIDCGGGYPEDELGVFYGSGRLACLRLDDMKVFYSEENYGKGSELE